MRLVIYIQVEYENPAGSWSSTAVSHFDQWAAIFSVDRFTRFIRIFGAPKPGIPFASAWHQLEMHPQSHPHALAHLGQRYNVFWTRLAPSTRSCKRSAPNYVHSSCTTRIGSGLVASVVDMLSTCARPASHSWDLLIPGRSLNQCHNCSFEWKARRIMAPESSGLDSGTSRALS
jgi:hypothetical protein